MKKIIHTLFALVVLGVIGINIHFASLSNNQFLDLSFKNLIKTSLAQSSENPNEDKYQWVYVTTNTVPTSRTCGGFSYDCTIYFYKITTCYKNVAGASHQFCNIDYAWEEDNCPC
jgi:hypothetical protein